MYLFYSMPNKIESKQQLYNYCEQKINANIALIDDQMKAMQDAANQETKGSAGDKHETGRAMMHLEKEKLAGQMNALMKQQELLSKIQVKPDDQAQLGSLVDCSIGKVYLAVAIGKAQVEGEDYLIISTASPIGRLLIGKKAGDEIVFNGKKIEVKEVN